MSPSLDPLAVRALAPLYRAMLLAYPADFRRRFGTDLLATYRDTARGAWRRGGWSAFPRLLGRSLTDIFYEGLSERLEATGLRRATGSSAVPPVPTRNSSPSVTTMLESILQDIRFALRSLRRSPALTATVVATMALAMGAVATMYTAVNSIVLRPLPYPDPDRLVVLWESGDEMLRGAVSPVDLADWQASNQSFALLGGFRSWRATLSDVEVPESLRASRLSYEVLLALGVDPQHGRLFTADEDRPEAPNAVILTDGLWRRQFAADKAIVGDTIRLNDEQWTVIGIMPAGFVAPRNPGAELLAPLRIDPDYYSRGSRVLNSLGRLLPGISLEEAQADMGRIAARLEADYPDSNHRVGVRLVPLHEETVGAVSQQLYVLLGAVGFVLLIAVANVANLLVARAAARRDEIALRAALGAGTGRLTRQLLTESILMAVAGGGLGVVFAHWGTATLIALAPSDIPRLDQVQVDGTVLALVAVLSIVTGLLFGAAPALHARTDRLSDALRANPRHGSGPHGNGIRRVLVVGQVAVALVLLIGAGLLLNSFQRLLSEDPGFDPTGVMATRARLGQAYSGTAAQELFFTQLRQQLKQRPEVDEVATVFLAPFAGGSVSGSFSIEGRNKPDIDDAPYASIQAVSPEFFGLLRMRLTAGRDFLPTDGPEDERVAVINETTARLYWPDADPVGAVLDLGVSLDDQEPDTPRRIVGVVVDSRNRSLGRPPVPIVYVPYRQYPTRSMYVLIRGSAGTSGVAPAIREVVAELDPNVALQSPRRLDGLVSDSVATERFATVLIGAFAVIAVALGCIGIYGLLAYSVAARTNEIGVRMALGARSMDVVGLLLRETAWLAAAGLLIGLAGSYGLARFLEGMLYQVSATDSPTFLTMATVLALFAFAATLVPARRASRVDPLEALRAD